MISQGGDLLCVRPDGAPRRGEGEDRGHRAAHRQEGRLPIPGWDNNMKGVKTTCFFIWIGIAWLLALKGAQLFAHAKMIYKKLVRNFK